MHEKPGVHTWGNLKGRWLTTTALARKDPGNLQKLTERGSTIWKSAPLFDNAVQNAWLAVEKKTTNGMNL
jgi:hypothetical protein